MKTKERDDAILLRQNGQSINDISKTLGVSKGSVSKWVKNVVLTSEQKDKLNERNPVFRGQLNTVKRSETYRNRRKEFQEEGREMAKHGGVEYAIGCMLYWAEGTKASKNMDFTNSDINMLRTFVAFVKKYWNIENKDIGLGLNCYLDHDLSVEEIFDYWIGGLGLGGCRINKAVVRNSEYSSFNLGRKKSKLKYGVLKLRFGNMRMLQNIFGSIQEYCKFNEEKWLG